MGWSMGQPMQTTSAYFTTAEAARRWGVTPPRARQIGDAGLVRVMRLENGLRLFDAADVERLAEERARRRGTSAA
jgi:hypothetical protein